MLGRYENITHGKDGNIYPFRTHFDQRHKQGILVDSHYHEYIEILYIVKGSFFILLDGEGHVCQKGDMVVINSMEVHNIQSPTNDPVDYIVVRFTPDLLYTTSQSIFEAKYVLPFTMKTSTHQKVFRDTEIACTPIPELLNKILDEGYVQAYGFELAIRTYIGEIFLYILRSWHEKGLDLNINAGLDRDKLERLERIFDYVDAHYEETISVADMAERFNMSYSYFSRYFKNMMNRNFSDYVNLVRVTKAEYLLASTNDSITTIATSVGFSTTSYFIEQFKHFKNITPKKFRQCFIND